MHKIEYRDACSDWSEALPLGNGHFGAMGYLDSAEGLTFVVNHYDVYYKILPQHSQKARVEDRPKEPWLGNTLDRLRQRAIEAHADPHHPGHAYYPVIYDPALKTSYGARREGSSNAIAGMLRLGLAPGVLEAGPFHTRLRIEEACLEFSARNREVNVNAIVAKDADLLVASVSQRCAGIKTVELSVPRSRKIDLVSESGSTDGAGFYIQSRFYPLDEDKEKYPPFSYVWMVKLVGARGRLIEPAEPHRLTIDIDDGASEFVLLATVVSTEETTDLHGTALRRLNEAQSQLPQQQARHREYWQGFFSQSAVQLPDPMLETLWYLHLYSLACCTGEGSRLYQEACGLNGLWDIKAPTQWGSGWYWDVNIQQAFWPVFTANHLELAKPFHKGLLSYVDKARRWARDFYSLDGIAADYPFDVYLCIWPWCAQFFWWYYKYSGDTTFLKETAYPLFKEIIRFIEGYLKEDPATGNVFIFPDVSPEQGPMTRNSTISLATWKYLLQFTIEASRLLQEDPKDRARWETLVQKFPEYPTGDHETYGPIIKDSEWAPADTHLAHASVLMPIYPIGEQSRKSPPAQRTLLLNTYQYAAGSMAIGTHPMWLAPAAARLGLGDETVRILKEWGVGLMMRANGLLSEETERWIQDCLVACAPVCNPPFMEAGGVLVAAINEMLLQSFDGVIEVFPALPEGRTLIQEKTSGFVRLGKAFTPARPCWQDCAFDRLLAEGGFEVSAVMKTGQVQRVTIKSLCGNKLRLVNPFGTRPDIQLRCGDEAMAFENQNGILTLATVSGGVYEFQIKDPASLPATEHAGPLVYTSPTRRRIFLGKDEHTEFYRAIDGATHDYYSGSNAVSRVTLYKLDFTAAGPAKQYDEVLLAQYHNCGKQGLDFTRLMTDQVFTPVNGLGWDKSIGLTYVDRKGPDCLRRDFIAGEVERELWMELPRGLYQLLVVTGDLQETTYTTIGIPGHTAWTSGPIRAGGFISNLFTFNHATDSVFKIKVSTQPGLNWKLSAMIVNRIP